MHAAGARHLSPDCYRRHSDTALSLAATHRYPSIQPDNKAMPSGQQPFPAMAAIPFFPLSMTDLSFASSRMRVPPGEGAPHRPACRCACAPIALVAPARFSRWELGAAAFSSQSRLNLVDGMPPCLCGAWWMLADQDATVWFEERFRRQSAPSRL